MTVKQLIDDLSKLEGNLAIYLAPDQPHGEIIKVEFISDAVPAWYKSAKSPSVRLYSQ